MQISSNNSFSSVQTIVKKVKEIVGFLAIMKPSFPWYGVKRKISLSIYFCYSVWVWL